MEGGGYSVIWWDPNALTLDARAPFGVRREDLIVKDVPKHVVADGRSRYDRWHLARADARDAGSIPSIRMTTVRDWAAAGSLADLAVPPSSIAIHHVPRADIEGRQR